jgi:repressor LexA
MKEKLTAKQRRMLDFISDCIQRSGAPPTIREIGRRFRMSSTNSVRDVLNALVRKGYIRRKPLVSRGIELVQDWASSFVTVPVVGRIAAGLPLTAVENLEGNVAVDSSLVSGGRVFSLRVTGDSMREAGIFDGDMVLVRQQPTAERGEIVVAIIGEEATVKRYYPERNRVRLEPANPTYEPIIVEKKAPGFFIAGKVIGLLRRM